MAQSLAGRAENRMQARILAHLRDEGSLSRAELADRLSVSRTTIAAEVSRLTELGLAAEIGQAASRGGRRSTLVDLSPTIRFVGISIGATSVSVAITDGRLGVLTMHTEDCDVRTGPEKVLATALELARKLLTEQGVTKPSGCGIGVPGPVDFLQRSSVARTRRHDVTFRRTLRGRPALARQVSSTAGRCSRSSPTFEQVFDQWNGFS